MAAAATAPAVDIVELKRVTVEPNECPLVSPIGIKLDYELSSEVKGAYWAVFYVIDTVRRRHLIQLGTTSVGDLGKGPNSMEFAAKELNFAGVKASRLTTAGMLTCALRRAAEGAPADGDEELAAVNMVVQVETASGKPAGKTTDPSELVRTVFDPLA